MTVLAEPVVEAVRLRALRCEALLIAIRAEARKGEWGLQSYVLNATDGMGLPEPRIASEPEAVPAWCCPCAERHRPGAVGVVACSSSWCQR